MNMPDHLKLAADTARLRAAEMAKANSPSQGGEQNADSFAVPGTPTPANAPTAEAGGAGEGNGEQALSYEELARRYANLRRHRTEEHQSDRRKIVELEAKLAGKGADGTEPPAKSSFIDPSDRDDMGEAEARAIDKVAASTDERLKKIEAREAQIAEREKDNFLTELASQVGNYEAINADPGFIAWLREEGRGAKLTQAVSTNDSSLAIRLFKDYDKVAAAARGTTPDATAFVAEPPNGGTFNPNADVMVEEWSRQEIKDNSDEKNRLKRSGRWSPGTPETDVVIEREAKISQAILEGRVY